MQPPAAAAAPAPARPPTLTERTDNLEEGLKETVGEVGTAVGQIVDGLGQTRWGASAFRRHRRPR